MQVDPTTCRRCAAPPAGVVAVSELDEGRAASTVAEVALCAEHLADVAVACGFERPEELRPSRRLPSGSRENRLARIAQARRSAEGPT